MLSKNAFRSLVKQCLAEVIVENKHSDPTKEEMIEFLRESYGKEEGFQDSAEIAIYWFANHYHSGQWSNLYSVLSTSPFRPGRSSNGPELGSMEEMMYHSLVQEYETGTEDTRMFPGEFGPGDKPVMDEALNTYYTIIILKYNEAKPVIDLLKSGNVNKAIDYLAQWDYAGESEHGMSISKTPPWGKDDRTYKLGKYTLFYNPNFDYVGLARLGTKLKETSQSSNIPTCKMCKKQFKSDSELLPHLGFKHHQVPDDQTLINGIWNDVNKLVSDNPYLKQFVKETSQPEPYDAKSDTFQPSPRDRTEPSKTNVQNERGRQCTVYVKNGRLAGRIVSAILKSNGVYYYLNPDTGTDEPLGTANDVQVHNRKISENSLSKLSIPGFPKAIVSVSGDIVINGKQKFVVYSGPSSTDLILGMGDNEAEAIANATKNASIIQGRKLNEAGEVKVDRISNSDRKKIGAAFAKLGLDGNGRFEKKEYGLHAVQRALSDLGFQLDMVVSDMIMGDKGSRNLTFRRVNNPGDDPYTEKPAIKNSSIVFVWENLERPGEPGTLKRFEVLSYAS